MACILLSIEVMTTESTFAIPLPLVLGLLVLVGLLVSVPTFP